MQSIQPLNADNSLIRGMGPRALTAFAINMTVGAGIFGLPARIQALVGNYSVAVVIICGLLIALIALCFAEIGSRFDRSGNAPRSVPFAILLSVGSVVVLYTSIQIVCVGNVRAGPICRRSRRHFVRQDGIRTPLLRIFAARHCVDRVAMRQAGGGRHGCPAARTDRAERVAGASRAAP